MADYAGFAEQPAGARAEGRLIGMGICVYHQLTGTGPFEGGSVRVDPSGEVTVNAGAAPQGQGTATMLAQIAADELQVDGRHQGRVRRHRPLAFGIGTYASRNAVDGRHGRAPWRRPRCATRPWQLAGAPARGRPSRPGARGRRVPGQGRPDDRGPQLSRDRGRGAPGRQPAAEGMEPDLESVQYFENMAAALLRSASTSPRSRSTRTPGDDGHPVRRRQRRRRRSSTRATPRDRSPAGSPRDSAAR